MKFCDACWSALRAAIEARGLMMFVARDGIEVAQRLVSGNDGATKANFEPLMGAHNAILANALRVVGLELMSPNDDGTQRCPICFLKEPGWIECAADEMHTEAIRLGLIAVA